MATTEIIGELMQELADLQQALYGKAETLAERFETLHEMREQLHQQETATEELYIDNEMLQGEIEYVIGLNSTGSKVADVIVEIADSEIRRITTIPEHKEYNIHLLDNCIEFKKFIKECVPPVEEIWERAEAEGVC